MELKLQILTHDNKAYLCKDTASVNKTLINLGTNVRSVSQIKLSGANNDDRLNLRLSPSFKKHLREKSSTLGINISQYLKLLVSLDTKCNLINKG